MDFRLADWHRESKDSKRERREGEREDRMAAVDTIRDGERERANENAASGFVKLH